MILETRGLTRTFSGLKAVSSLDFSVPAGSVRAIIGPNGAGKTTLFNVITGTLPSSGGEILFEGRSIAGKSPEQIARLGISRTFQLTSAFPELTALENIWLGVNARHGSLSPFTPQRKIRDLEARAHAILESIGLGERGHIPAGELSYGQQRMLDIGTALSTDPRLLMLDEPTAGLGVKETASMAALIKRLAQRMTIIVIEHDIEVVLEIADAITVLYNGELLLEGAPEDIMSNETVQRIYLGHQVHVKGGIKGEPHADA